jgi:hypothetical protein
MPLREIAKKRWVMSERFGETKCWEERTEAVSSFALDGGRVFGCPFFHLMRAEYALSDYEYVAKLAKAGFDNIDIEPTRVYSIEDARAFLSGQGPRRR